MNMKTAGIHHITAIVGNIQENVDFYASILGLRLVKKTINFDDPGTYHLYFGDNNGSPGTIMTFFPWQNAKKGEIGAGQVGTITFAIPKGSKAFWQDRLVKYNVSYRTTSRFDQTYLSFEDPHGLQLELTEIESSVKSMWTFNGVQPDHAIIGFASATLLSADYLETNKLIEEGLGFTYVGKDGEFLRFVSEAELGNTIDVWQVDAAPGTTGVGMVHHIAFRSKDDADQLDWKKEMEQLGMRVTPVQSRNYFNAIYFREPGGLLFEIATDPPGFTHDESQLTMGNKLMLADWFEAKREQIEKQLPSFHIREM